MVAFRPMATFQCQTCGNLHGAPVETCGICGSSAVAFMPEPGTAPLPRLQNEAHELRAVDYAAIDQARDARRDRLDDQDTDRRERITLAAVDLLVHATTLADRLIELVEAATEALHANATTKRDPA